eukprot:1161146-Pelagomonas_calceolata.AAC.3
MEYGAVRVDMGQSRWIWAVKMQKAWLRDRALEPLSDNCLGRFLRLPCWLPFQKSSPAAHASRTCLINGVGCVGSRFTGDDLNGDKCTSRNEVKKMGYLDGLPHACCMMPLESYTLPVSPACAAPSLSAPRMPHSTLLPCQPLPCLL